MRQNKKNKGFTLVELLIVVAIIGILAAVLTPQFLNARRVAVDRSAEAFATNIYTAVQAEIAEKGADAPNSTDCSAGYTAGAYVVAKPGFTLESCDVKGNMDNPSVKVVYKGGANPDLDGYSTVNRP